MSKNSQVEAVLSVVPSPTDYERRILTALASGDVLVRMHFMCCRAYLESDKKSVREATFDRLLARCWIEVLHGRSTSTRYRISDTGRTVLGEQRVPS